MLGRYRIHVSLLDMYPSFLPFLILFQTKYENKLANTELPSDPPSIVRLTRFFLNNVKDWGLSGGKIIIMYRQHDTTQ